MNKNKFKNTNRKRPLELKRGSMEIVGYMVCLPFLMIVVLALMATVQISVVKQTMEFASYSAARAMSLSSKYTVGKQRAEIIIDAYIKGNSSYNIKPVFQSVGLKHKSYNNVSRTDSNAGSKSYSPDCIDYYLVYIGNDSRYGSVSFLPDGEVKVSDKTYSDMYNRGKTLNGDPQVDTFMNEIWQDSIMVLELTISFDTVCPFLQQKTVKSQQIMRVEQ